MEIVNVQMEADKFAAVAKHCNLEVNTDYIIKSVRIDDDMFKDDATHKELKKAAAKAYLALNNYEFDKRNP
jgi:hypothetical protein